jgi:hypothetical protein
MDYTLLEDAYPDGGDFKSRTPIREGKSDEPADIRRRTNPAATKTADNLVSVLPLDTDQSTSNFKPPVVRGDGGQQVYQYQGKQRPSGIPVQEAFTTQSTGDDMKMKMDKILAMVEQNKTGYEPNSTNDMFLYILTGVMFLFTFDTFVMLGKSMRT